MKTCKTCKFWNCDYNVVNGISDCSLIDTIQPKGRTDFAAMDIKADDDSNLTAVFFTGEDFGCIHHDLKRE